MPRIISSIARGVCVLCALLGCAVKRLPLDPCEAMDACAPGDTTPSRVDVAVTECTAAELDQVARAVALTRRFSEARGAEMTSATDCLFDAFFSPGDGASVEALTEQMITASRALAPPWPSRVACAEGPSPLIADISRDGIIVGREALAASRGDAESLAGAILAESARHAFEEIRGSRGQLVEESAFSAASQVAACAAGALRGEARPHGQPRSRMEHEVELQAIGGGESPAFDALCPETVIGLGVVRRDAVERLDVRCDEAGTMIRLGGASLPANASPTSYRCPAGMVMIGARGVYAPASVASLVPLCAEAAQVRARVPVEGSVAGAEPVVTRANETYDYVRRCPPGMVVRGFYGRAARRPDQVRVVCRGLDTASLAAPVALAPVGTGTVVGRRDFCTDQGALVGFQGSATAGIVTRAGGLCRGLRRQGNDWTLRTDGDEHVTPARGISAPGASAFSELATSSGGSARCGPGEALVGVAARVSGRGTIENLEGICAQATGWIAGRSPATRRTARFGAAGAPTEERLCSAGSLLVGIDVLRNEVDPNSGAALAVLCRDFSVGGGR
jgi:hypothetical protein